MSNQRYEIRPYKVHVRDDGRTASICGACPWTSNAEKTRWKIEQRGFTVFDHNTNTSGFGRPPFKTQEEAQAFIARLTA